MFYQIELSTELILVHSYDFKFYQNIQTKDAIVFLNLFAEMYHMKTVSQIIYYVKLSYYFYQAANNHFYTHKYLKL